jgi:hypothetical protein
MILKTPALAVSRTGEKMAVVFYHEEVDGGLWLQMYNLPSGKFDRSMWQAGDKLSLQSCLSRAEDYPPGEAPHPMSSCGMAFSLDDTILAVTGSYIRSCIHLVHLNDNDRVEDIGEELLEDPVDVAFTPNSFLVIADFKGQEIVIMALDGSPVFSFPVLIDRSQPNLHFYPHALAVDRKSNIIVMTANGLSVFSKRGQLLHTELGGFNREFYKVPLGGVAIDAATGKVVASNADSEELIVL